MLSLDSRSQVLLFLMTRTIHMYLIHFFLLSNKFLHTFISSLTFFRTSSLLPTLIFHIIFSSLLQHNCSKALIPILSHSQYSLFRIHTQPHSIYYVHFPNVFLASSFISVDAINFFFSLKMIVSVFPICRHLAVNMCGNINPNASLSVTNFNSHVVKKTHTRILSCMLCVF